MQVAVRTPKKDGNAVLVSTDFNATLEELLLEYDQRSGAPENSFAQDYQALSLRKYRKAGFIAQQVLLLLAELAHNLMIWMKTWFMLRHLKMPRSKLKTHIEKPERCLAGD